MPRNIFGAQLRAVRKLQGLTQEQLAERAGVTTSMVWSSENGKAQNAVTLNRILDALGHELRIVPKVSRGETECSRV